jgi:hypothetical protein
MRHHLSEMLQEFSGDASPLEANRKDSSKVLSTVCAATIKVQRVQQTVDKASARSL